MSHPANRARRAATATLPMLLAIVAPPATAAPPDAPAVSPYAVPPCAAAALALRADEQDGRFTGMSHAGAVVTVRNAGETACAVSGVPALAFRDRAGRTVATGVPAGARFMHPGPVVPPVALAPGVIAALTLRWVSGDVYTGGRRAAAASLALAAHGGAARTLLVATAYGPAGGVTFEQSRLTTALPPLGAPAAPVSERYVGSGPEGSTLITAAGAPARVLTLGLASHTAARFSFDLVGGGAAPNLGSIAGRARVRAARATFADRARDCGLGFAFYGAQVVVTQSGTCGFGDGVSAAGRYTAAQ